MPTAPTPTEIIEALASLRAEIGVDQRLRNVELGLAEVQATMRVSAKPPVWPAVTSAVVAVAALLVAFATLLTSGAS